VEAFPGIDLPAQPIDMRMTPDGNKWWIVGMEGQIMEASNPRLLVSYGILRVSVAPYYARIPCSRCLYIYA